MPDFTPPPVGRTAIEPHGQQVALLYNSPNSGLLVLGYTPKQARALADELRNAADKIA